VGGEIRDPRRGDLSMGKMDIVFAGLGGQGVMTLLQVLAGAAFRDNVPVKNFEGTGITQRGGGVFGFVRLGETYGPKIPVGEADAIISLEISEIVNVIHYLKPQGQVWANSEKVHGYYTRLHPDRYPLQEKIEGLVRLKTSSFHLLPATRLAQQAGSPQAVNMVMLGAFSKINTYLKTDSITRAIEETNKKFAASNLEAFWKGYHFFEAASTSEKGPRAAQTR
jgi:indolepyruvate ferredoxin oxidoreductase beta subunit